MTTEEKEIYAIGEIPPLGFVPKKMHAWVIRRDRHGNPMQSFQEEEFDVPEVGPSEVLILVMATGVNYNGVWAGLGKPISVLDVTKKDYHIAGSDCSGIVWKVGSDVKKWKVGDEVIIHGMQWDHEDAEVNGGEPLSVCVWCLCVSAHLVLFLFYFSQVLNTLLYLVFLVLYSFLSPLTFILCL